MIIALSAVLAFSLSGAQAQGATSGVVVNGLIGLPAQGDAQIAGLGVGWVRGFVPWSQFEEAQGHLNESRVNALEASLAAL